MWRIRTKILPTLSETTVQNETDTKNTYFGKNGLRVNEEKEEEKEEEKQSRGYTLRNESRKYILIHFNHFKS